MVNNISVNFKSQNNIIQQRMTIPINEPDKIVEEKEGKSNKGLYVGTSALATIALAGLAICKHKSVSSASKTATEQFKTPIEKAKIELEKLYDGIIDKAKNTGNQKRVSSFETVKGNMKNLSNDTVYSNLLETLYKELRCAEYPSSAIKTKNIENVTGSNTAQIMVKNSNGWHYRIPKARVDKKTVDRISVNANADENLIKSLDDLFATGGVKGYYKTPEMPADWLERHDPITIYLDETATPETLEKIKKACEKYIRSKEDVLSGNKFAEGFALQKSPTEADIEEVLRKMKDIDVNLEGVVRKSFTDNRTGTLKTSAGYMDCANKIIDMLK